MKAKFKVVVFVFWWILAVLAGAAVYSEARAASHTPNQVRICQEKLARLTDSSVMSRTTANREALAVCKSLKKSRPYFYRAIVR